MCQGFVEQSIYTWMFEIFKVNEEIDTHGEGFFYKEREIK